MVAELVRACGHSVAGYVDGDPGKRNARVDSEGRRVRFDEKDLLAKIRAGNGLPDGIDACALGIGDNHRRQKRFQDLMGLEMPPLIHPTASVSPRASVGRASVVFPLAIVNADAVVGDCVIVNSGAIIEHDCRLGDGVHVSPGAVLCGGVQMDECVWVGAGATVIHGVRIGKDSIVGAGSTVIRDVESSVKVVGSPASVIGATESCN
jgi:sugar O-acyltransferase (sialic acid O-acetyltransferase NeuD family)